MPELRQEPITNKWVIIATERSKRPSDFTVKHDEKKESKSCPFCQGNESQTPPEIMAYRQPDSKPNESGWWLRVVPNKFPALSFMTHQKSTENFYKMLPGIGVHEVIIETPDHDTSIEKQPISQIKEIFRAWKERHDVLMKTDPIKYVQIFKNSGAVAGASLEHPHSQLIATPLVPNIIENELYGSKRLFEDHGGCFFCKINEYEMNEKIRLIAENDDFVAYCPYASRFPFETWILPKKHQASFSMLDKNYITSLSYIVKDAIQKINNALDQPPYNLLLHTAPVGYIDAPFYHWHFEIIPRLTVVAGFEWGTGIFINPTSPEAAASYLRETTDNNRTDKIRGVVFHAH